ncbi:MAG TPA: hypothetical protein VLJ59_13420 [Mycobacteriales bacterium]|nr:hypothetical protein [Mycobacteriales bacterium]
MPGREKAAGSSDAVVTITENGSSASASSAVWISLASFWYSVEAVTSTTGLSSLASQDGSGSTLPGSHTPGPTSRTAAGRSVRGVLQRLRRVAEHQRCLHVHVPDPPDRRHPQPGTHPVDCGSSRLSSPPAVVRMSVSRSRPAAVRTA